MNTLHFDLVAVGGGVGGVCFALAAAREGVNTLLITDRPMLGGNASAEVGVAPSGAINFNSFTMETGILVDAMLTDREKNDRPMAESLSLTLAELVMAEKSLTLMDNTRVVDCRMEGTAIRSLLAKGLTYETTTEIFADAFADCTGDAVLARLAGAEVMYGREARSQFGEALAPETADGMVMGTTVLFCAKRTPHRVVYTPPAFARTVNREDLAPGVDMAPPKGDTYSGFWWLEFGGPRHTVNDERAIAKDLYAWVYGVWDYLKNRSEYKTEFENFELSRVSTIPGKRESYRVVGDVVLTEGDVRSGGKFPDALSTGGWYIDLHNPGSFTDTTGKIPLCNDFADPVYENYALIAPFGIPLRAMYSRDVTNLWLAGRVISASHVAFGAIRVECTLGNAGQAAGIAAAYAHKHGLTPREAATSPHIDAIRHLVAKSDIRVPGYHYTEESLMGATVTSSGDAILAEIAPGEEAVSLDTPWGICFPVTESRLDSILLPLRGIGELSWRLCAIRDVWDRSDGALVAEGSTHVTDGIPVTLPISANLTPGSYRLSLSGRGLSWPKGKDQPYGVLAQYYFASNKPGTTPLSEANVPPYSAWNSQRGKRFALAATFCPPQRPYGPENVLDGFCHQDAMPNLWLSIRDEGYLDVTLPEARSISGVTLVCDTDLNRNVTTSTGRAPASPDKILVFADGKPVAELLSPTGRLVTIPFPSVRATTLRIQLFGGSGGLYSLRIL